MPQYKIIAHRANLNGPSVRENTVLSIIESIARGFDVEIDLRVVSGELFLGHDAALWRVNFNFLKKYVEKLWIHAKNREALEYLSCHDCFNYFWHESDEYTITSKGFLWCYPGNVAASGVVVLPELDAFRDWSGAAAICTDWALLYDKIYNKNRSEDEIKP